MVNLRSYQQNAIDIIKETFKKWFRQYVEMPTGSGKTITFLSYAKQNHKKILIVVPSKELLRQVFETALIFYEPHEISRKGSGFNETISDVHICIIHSMRGDYLEFITRREFDLVIIDEAHHSQANSYQRFIKNYSRNYFDSTKKDCKILGVTATPDRSDGLFLKDILQICSFKLTIEELIQQKHLSDIEGFSVKTKIDLSDIDDHNGDFSLNQLYKKLCLDSRNQMIVDLCKKNMKDRKSLIFCININHSKIISKLLNDNGIISMHIDGTMDHKKRNSILTLFRNGEISVLCNCQLLTEGFDEPSIDGIILARPTRSKALFLQMIGRGLRTYPNKKNCKIIDIVDNHKNLIGFNSLVSDEKYIEMECFNNFKDIKTHISEEMLKVSEYKIERINLLNLNKIDNLEVTDSMIEYLNDNSIYYQYPLSFDEASFLIWFNELKKEYANG